MINAIEEFENNKKRLKPSSIKKYKASLNFSNNL